MSKRIINGNEEFKKFLNEVKTQTRFTFKVENVELINVTEFYEHQIKYCVLKNCAVHCSSLKNSSIIASKLYDVSILNCDIDGIDYNKTETGHYGELISDKFVEFRKDRKDHKGD